MYCTGTRSHSTETACRRPPHSAEPERKTLLHKYKRYVLLGLGASTLVNHVIVVAKTIIAKREYLSLKEVINRLRADWKLEQMAALCKGDQVEFEKKWGCAIAALSIECIGHYRLVSCLAFFCNCEIAVVLFVITVLGQLGGRIETVLPRDV